MDPPTRIKGAAVNEYFTPAVVDADPKANVTDLLVGRLAETPDSALFSVPTADGGWSDVTTREFYDQVVALAKGMIAAGVKPGEKIGFMCKTRYEWTLIDFATWFAGAVLVPIYETSAPAQIQYILEDSGATGIILETPEHFTRFDEIASDVPQVTKVWQMGNGDIEKLATSGGKVSDADLEKRRSAAVGTDPPPSSTPRAPPACPRAASSRTRTSSN
jgi:long-chain acyl-CoA synthetase